GADFDAMRTHGAHFVPRHKLFAVKLAGLFASEAGDYEHRCRKTVPPQDGECSRIEIPVAVVECNYDAFLAGQAAFRILEGFGEANGLKAVLNQEPEL